MAESLFLRVSSYLKTVTKARMPIKVRRVVMKDDLLGLCEEKKGFFLIKVRKNLPEEHAIDILIHEIAHADSWEQDKDFHGKNWGVSYSRLYRAFVEKFIDS